VLAVDSELGWLYVAAESGVLSIFDLHAPGVAKIGREHPGASAHTVAVDPRTHRVYLPLEQGPDGVPVLRVMQPRKP
jgi:hypothetical protein